MVKAELNKRSPLRVFENSIHGGVGKGNIGVLASRKGVGKTACLVHIAMDKLFRNRHVIHVSFSSRVDHIVNWYEDIFKEIAKKRNLEEAVKVHDEIIKNRVIMNFKQEGMETGHVLNSVKTMITDGKFDADCIIFDGYDPSKTEPSNLEVIKAFAKEINLEIWASIGLKGQEPLFSETGIPTELKDCLEQIEVLVTLKFEGDYVHFNVVKDHGDRANREMNLKLDPKTLLIAEK